MNIKDIGYYFFVILTSCLLYLSVYAVVKAIEAEIVLTISSLMILSFVLMVRYQEFFIHR